MSLLFFPVIVSITICINIIIIVIIILMVDAPQIPSKEIYDEFFALQLAPNSQSGKSTTRPCKFNVLLGKMVPFLGLKNTCIANQYAPN